MVKITYDRALSTLFAFSAVAVAATVVWREFNPRVPISAARPAAPVYLAEWEDNVSSGIRMGPADAAVTIMEFMDFECPFCRMHAARADSLRAEFRAEVAVVVHHYPLPNHRFAQLAAVASECAALQGRFEQFYHLLLQKQDSIGIIGWPVFAQRAAVGDTVAFEQCRTTNRTFSRIEDGKTLGERAGVMATPTIVVNGWKMPSPPTLAELREHVRTALSGQEIASSRPETRNMM